MTKTHFSILTWRIPWPDSLVGHSPQGHKVSDTTERQHTLHTLPSTHSCCTTSSLPVQPTCCEGGDLCPFRAGEFNCPGVTLQNTFPSAMVADDVEMWLLCEPGLDVSRAPDGPRGPHNETYTTKGLAGGSRKDHQRKEEGPSWWVGCSFSKTATCDPGRQVFHRKTPLLLGTQLETIF